MQIVCNGMLLCLHALFVIRRKAFVITSVCNLWNKYFMALMHINYVLYSGKYVSSCWQLEYEWHNLKRIVAF